MFTITKIRQADNQNRDKRRTANKEKDKKREPFKKVLAAEMNNTTPKPGR
jgi:hypothetical protein